MGYAHSPSYGLDLDFHWTTYCRSCFSSVVPFPFQVRFFLLVWVQPFHFFSRPERINRSGKTGKTISFSGSVSGPGSGASLQSRLQMLAQPVPPPPESPGLALNREAVQQVKSSTEPRDRSRSPPRSGKEHSKRKRSASRKKSKKRHRSQSSSSDSSASSSSSGSSSSSRSSRHWDFQSFLCFN